MTAPAWLHELIARNDGEKEPAPPDWPWWRKVRWYWPRPEIAYRIAQAFSLWTSGEDWTGGRCGLCGQHRFNHSSPWWRCDMRRRP